jgi:hypothetical protein
MTYPLDQSATDQRLEQILIRRPCSSSQNSVSCPTHSYGVHTSGALPQEAKLRSPSYLLPEPHLPGVPTREFLASNFASEMCAGRVSLGRRRRMSGRGRSCDSVMQGSDDHAFGGTERPVSAASATGEAIVVRAVQCTYHPVARPFRASRSRAHDFLGCRRASTGVVERITSARTRVPTGATRAPSATSSARESVGWPKGRDVGSTQRGAAMNSVDQLHSSRRPLRHTYRGLLQRGLQPSEAGNLVAHLTGLRICDQPWSLGEVNALLFLRYVTTDARELGRLPS